MRQVIGTVERNEILRKVGAGGADEVGERGAYRMVNRILQLLAEVSSPVGHPGLASR